jgi:transposase-like protein
MLHHAKGSNFQKPYPPEFRREAQPDADSLREQHGRVGAQLERRFPEAALLLEEAGPEILAFTSFPKEHWRQLWSTLERRGLRRLDQRDLRLAIGIVCSR